MVLYPAIGTFSPMVAGGVVGLAVIFTLIQRKTDEFSWKRTFFMGAGTIVGLNVASLIA